MTYPTFTPQLVTGLRVQKSRLSLPPGVEIGSTRTVSNPTGCCGTPGEGVEPPPGFEISLTTLRIPTRLLGSPALTSAACEDLDADCCDVGSPCVGDTEFPQILYCHVEGPVFSGAGLEGLPADDVANGIAYFSGWFPMHYAPGIIWQGNAGHWQVFTAGDDLTSPPSGAPSPKNFMWLTLTLSGSLTTPTEGQKACFAITVGGQRIAGFATGINVFDLPRLDLANSSLDPLYLRFQDEATGYDVVNDEFTADGGYFITA